MVISARICLIAIASQLSIISAEMTMQMVAYKAIRTPCCMDTLMPSVCKGLYNRDHEKFAKSCRTNPDFSFIQCCHSCHFNMDMFTSESIPVPNDLYQKDVEELLLQSSPRHCFDRHGTAFCEAFVTRSGFWGRKSLSCQNSVFAFRVCRKTCGYCSTPQKPATVRYNSDHAKNPKTCEKLF
ncbi:unnamed protein product [Caenorhabditis bovis]|uniref:ShKT domain-containing protein n=1 Tax=Caenorhabditis bovis TaxID=2654633 RepID=A0A8S1EL69_9PELO|nr:unnamed protein product [Caenorhabditis bovis]